MSSKITLKPYVRTLIGDLDTPVSAYLKLSGTHSFLLESVSGGEQVARYSFIGIDPFCVLKATDAGIDIETDLLDHAHHLDGSIAALEALVSQVHMNDDASLPPFTGGAVGFFSWDVIGEIEPVTATNKKDANFPIAHFMMPRSIVVFDHAKRSIILITLSQEENDPEAAKRLDDIEAKLSAPLPQHPQQVSTSTSDDIFDHVDSNMTQNEYEANVEKAKKRIYDGDIFQLVLSQKFSLTSDKNPFDIYRRLRVINPSPYMYYMNFGDYQVVGSSPEILVKLDDNVATVRPIAGTRPRNAGNEDDVVADLKQDEKEIAEHIMLVDLGRNDLGRVCEFESIKASDLMSIEAYSHVYHMVTNVTGEMTPGKNAFDLFRATFPAGTLSGAPKVKAIEIIHELEPDRRGPYGGALGYFDFRGNMDLCIIIRTVLAKAGQLTVQAGAGIVADSIPQREYEETQNKAKGMIQACL